MTQYKVEELLALRDSISESAVSIEKLEVDDCVKEHVLRASSSTNCMSTKSENTPLDGNTKPNRAVSGPPRCASQPVKEQVFGNQALKKPSPTPSMKRGKAERLIKEHGSPPGMRVTAGGRVVPTDFTSFVTPIPLFHPVSKDRVPDLSAGKPDNTYHAPAHQPIPQGFIGYDIKGQLCQKVGDTLLPVPLINGIPHFHLPPINSFPAIAPVPGPPAPPAQPTDSRFGNQMGNMPTPTESAATNIDEQIVLLENQYKSLDKERQQFERYEVIEKERASVQVQRQLVEKKRWFIMELDRIRRAAKQLKDMKDSGATTLPNSIGLEPQHSAPAPAVSHQHTAGFVFPGQMAPPPAPTTQAHPMFRPGHVMPFDASLYGAVRYEMPPPAYYHYNGMHPGMHPAFFPVNGGMSGHNFGPASLEINGIVRGRSVNADQPFDADRPFVRGNNAVEIKVPLERPRQGYHLDPTSPSYVPKNLPGPRKESSLKHCDVGTPTPVGSPDDSSLPRADLAKYLVGDDDKDQHTIRAHASPADRVNKKSSQSSVSTSAFFPVNTHEYSTKTLYGDRGGTDEENMPFESSAKGERSGFGIVPTNTPARGSEPANGKHESRASLEDYRLSSWTREIGQAMDLVLTNNMNHDLMPPILDGPAPDSPERYFATRCSPGRSETSEPSLQSVEVGYLDGWQTDYRPSEVLQSSKYREQFQRALEERRRRRAAQHGKPETERLSDVELIRMGGRPERLLKSEEYWAAFEEANHMRHVLLVADSKDPANSSTTASPLNVESPAGLPNNTDFKAVSASERSRQLPFKPLHTQSASEVQNASNVTTNGASKSRLVGNLEGDLSKPTKSRYSNRSSNRARQASRAVSAAIRPYPGNMAYSDPLSCKSPTSPKISNGWPVQCDGAVDDLAREMSLTTVGGSGPSTVEAKSQDTASNSGTPTLPSPTKGDGSTPSSPRKEKGSSSPARAKLEQIARKVKHLDKRKEKTAKAERIAHANMDGAQKDKHRRKWRARFELVRSEQAEEIRKYEEVERASKG